MAKKKGKAITIADIEAQEKKVQKLRDDLPVEEANLSAMKIELIESTSQEYGFDMKDLLDLMKDNAKTQKSDLATSKENVNEHSGSTEPFIPTN